MTKGSAARKSYTSSSALTYWSGIIQSCASINRKNAKGSATRDPVLAEVSVMHNFFAAFGHLLLQTLHSTVGWMGTTLLALAVGAINHNVIPYVDRLLDGETLVVKPSLKRIRGTVIVAVTTWLLLYGLNVIYAIYIDHRDLVSQNQSLIREAGGQKWKLQSEATKIQDLNNRLSALTQPEAPDSLRRRTVKLADEWTAYLVGMLESKNKPPDTFPISPDPDSSEEHKKAIQATQNYYRGLEEYYAKHFRDRFVGIVKEYENRGVRTGYLANEFAQRTPYIPQLASVMDGLDDISRFRDLAYHVDARDHLITF
jgi:hypothetical protein